MFHRRTYYLIADPHTGKVVRRAHEQANVSEMHLMSLIVDKQAWKTYGRHDIVQAADLDDDTRARWIAALASHTFMECPKCGTRRQRRDIGAMSILCAMCDGRVCPICQRPKQPSSELCYRPECAVELEKQKKAQQQHRRVVPFR